MGREYTAGENSKCTAFTENKGTSAAILANTPLEVPDELKGDTRALAFPRFGSDVEKHLWGYAARERLKGLLTPTPEAKRQMFDSQTKQDGQRKQFKRGPVKGIAAKVMRQSTGVHAFNRQLMAKGEGD